MRVIAVHFRHQCAEFLQPLRCDDFANDGPQSFFVRCHARRLPECCTAELIVHERCTLRYGLRRNMH